MASEPNGLEATSVGIQIYEFLAIPGASTMPSAGM